MNALKLIKMKRSHTFLILIFLSIVIASCNYDFIKKPEPVNPGSQVSFATQILPIFSTDGCTGCHKPGGQSPDYTAANAYNSIISNNVVNTTTPESSPLYIVPNPSTSGHAWDKYTDQQAQLVLLWIQQGANNN
jgi:hypothetical protein